MIKLHIPNSELPSRKKIYYEQIEKSVKLRLNILRTSLENFINTNIKTGGHTLGSLNPIGYKLMKIIDSKTAPSNRPIAKEYINTIVDFKRKNKIKINTLDFKVIIDLLHNLESKKDQLYDLLLAPPDKLLSVNDNLIRLYKIVPFKHLSIIKLAFNYEEFEEDISQYIKKFYWTPVEKLTYRYCPYCNLKDIVPEKMPDGSLKYIGTLDHFFNKDDYPLLSYSMFNLVPSCYECNMVYKKKINFNNDYHLNPHFSGMNNRMWFSPVIKGDFRKMDKIDIKYNQTNTAIELQQLIGDSKLPKANELGNLNVFNILSRYHKEGVEKAKVRLDRIHATNKNIPYLGKLIVKMFLKSDPELYREWYEKNMESQFDEKDFGKKMFSKFNRDIHNFYYNEIDRKGVNNYIRELEDNEEED